MSAGSWKEKKAPVCHLEHIPDTENPTENPRHRKVDYDIEVGVRLRVLGSDAKSSIKDEATR